ncbi:hypothetical protein BH20ACT21_BH20ACT21_25840 [soil metagenome]
MGNLFRQRRLILTAVAVSLVATVAALVWFQPQKLVIDQKVNEGLPDQPAALGEDAGEKKNTKASQSEAEPAIETLGAGRFRALAHPVSGRAKLLELSNGDRYLRFENFTVENGPDLRVYVSRAKATSDADAFGRDFVDLGGLKGNLGDQNYRVPAAATPRELNSAVIWCRRFSVGFAVAPLE